MADPSDLLNAWQDAIRELGRAAGAFVSRPAGVAGDLLEPFQRQAEQLERVLQRQLEFERDLLERVVAPARAALDLVDQATAAFRAQAVAFRAASVSFGQLADLMEQQAELVERASATIRDPVAALRSAAAQANRE
jgi:ABC-type transporter Mla subunit MlaD